MNTTQSESTVVPSIARLVLAVTIIAVPFAQITSAEPILMSSTTFIEQTHDKQYFRYHFPFGGGVVPRGSVVFYNSSNAKISASKLKLEILDRIKLTNGKPNYDAVGVSWNGKSYILTLDDDILLPLLEFVSRGSYIAYTLPEEKDVDYFLRNKLIKTSIDQSTYVAKEFIALRHQQFLKDIDFLGDGDMTEIETDPLPEKVVNSIKAEVNGSLPIPKEWDTYVNADFNVRYRAYLRTTNGQRTIEIAGLPLRYYWGYSSNRKAAITDVRILKFPDKKYSLRWRAVVFFQAAAILRQIKLENRAEFNRFLNEVRAVKQR